jgi:hypothetical protein
MSVVGAISVKILGDNSHLVKKLRESTEAVAKWGAASVAAATAVTAALVNQSRKAIDDQAKMARALGGTVDALNSVERAASRAGVSKSEMTQSVGKLNKALGDAIVNGGKSKDALDKLGLSAEQLSKLDVDERLAVIADRMSDMRMSTQQAQRTMMDLGIESNKFATFMQEGGAAIRESRDRLKEYGAAMSDVDAAKVEEANDALGELKIIWDGLVAQFTAKVAPMLTAISTMFADAAVEAGGMASIAESAFNKIVNGAGYVLDAINGVRVVAAGARVAFAAAGLGIVNVFDMIIQKALDFQNTIIQAVLSPIKNVLSIASVFSDQAQAALDKVQGIRLDKPRFMTDMVESMNASLSDAIDNFQERLNAPVPSIMFKKFVEDAEAAATGAAEAAVKARAEIDRSFGVDGDDEKSKEEQEKLRERLDKMRESLLEEEGLRRVQYEKQLEELQFLHESLGDEFYDYYEQRKAAEEQFLADMNSIRERKMTEQERIMEMSMSAQVALVSGELGNMLGAFSSHSKKMNKASQIASATQALIATFTGQAESLKLGWPLGAIAAAKIGAAGLGFVSAIKSAGSGGGGGGASSAGAGSVSAPAPAAPSRDFSVSLSGFNPNMAYGGGQLGGIVELINNEIRGGARLASITA